MRNLWAPLLMLPAVVAAAAQQPSRTPPADLASIAALAGEPSRVSAAGVTRSDTPIQTLENPGPFDATAQRRVVIVGGMDADSRGTSAALQAAKWFKSAAPAALKQRWALSVLPSADPDGVTRTHPARFPPPGGFFAHPDQPEARYVWRWVTYQAPDLVIEIHGGDSMAMIPPPADSLAAALSAAGPDAMGGAPTVFATVRETDGPRLLQQVLAAHAGISRSPLHERIHERASRDPLDLARLFPGKYPQNAIVSYIPSVTWTNMLRLADVANDSSLRDAVRHQTLPWTSGVKPLFGDRIALTAAAGTMIYADLAARGDETARKLAIQGAEAALAEGDGGIARFGQGWTDDMFMSGAILSRSGKMTGRSADLDLLAKRLIAYASRLQREDGIFSHFTDGKIAWGRGNGFAALGLAEALGSLPAAHPSRAAVLAIYGRQMEGLRKMQAPDGMWRQIIDEAGSYREESATAMTLSAMARGVRHGWLDRSYVPVIERAWRALAAHVTENGDIVDICTGTGAGPSRRYCFDREAISGADDRGGAMAFMAAMEMHELRTTTSSRNR